MFDISWSHLLAIAVVALLVIGPKDLPRVLRALGRWAGKARAVAREFQSSIDQMIRESELEEVRKEVEQVAATDVGREIEKSVDPKGELQASLRASESTDAVKHPAGTTETGTVGAAEPVAQPSGVEKQAGAAPPTETAAPAPGEAQAEAKPEKRQTAA